MIMQLNNHVEHLTTYGVELLNRLGDFTF